MTTLLRRSFIVARLVTFDLADESPHSKQSVSDSQFQAASFRQSEKRLARIADGDCYTMSAASLAFPFNSLKL